MGIERDPHATGASGGGHGSLHRVSDVTLVPVSPEMKPTFVSQIQEAFQVSFEDLNGPWSQKILPAEDVEQSFAAPGAEAYFAMSGDDVLGGAIITAEPGGERGELALLYVKVGSQGTGTGRAIWEGLEAMHPEVSVWETTTPYHEKRNIHFYVNKLGFHIVEFFHQGHRDPHQHGDQVGGMPADVSSELFRFEKRRR